MPKVLVMGGKEQAGVPFLFNLGERSHQAFEPIWQIIKCWHSFFYVTDGWKVYPKYIEQRNAVNAGT